MDSKILKDLIDAQQEAHNLKLRDELKVYVKTELKACAEEQDKNFTHKFNKTIFHLTWKLIVTIGTIVTIIINCEKFLNIF